MVSWVSVILSASIKTDWFGCSCSDGYGNDISQVPHFQFLRVLITVIVHVDVELVLK